MRRQDDILRKSTQGLGLHYVLAEVIELFLAVPAGETGCAVHCHDLITRLKSLYAFSDFCDDAGEFVSENTGHRYDGMPAPICLQVRSAGERSLYPDQYLTGRRDGRLYFTELNPAGLNEDICAHC